MNWFFLSTGLWNAGTFWSHYSNGEYMQIRDFTPEDYPALVAIHNSQNIVWPENPRTPAAWAEADRNHSPKTKYKRLMAVEGESVVGFTSYSQSPWNYPPGGFDINVEVHPDCQRRGIGSVLYEHLIKDIQAFNPPSLRADTFTNLPQGFAFLQKRGFYEAFRETPVHLDVTTFDPSPYAGLEPKLNSQELGSDPNRDRKIYDLMCLVDLDVPSEGDGIPEPDFEDWVGWGLNDHSVLQDAFLIAVYGDEYVGLRDLGSYGDSETLLGGLLGIRREYRQRGIALTLQIHSIAYARANGYRLLKDCTAIQNAPMQAMFNQLGFIRDPEWQQCQKDFFA
jgi:ribosomal protein S18 acetylase RimI-like enzyme